LSKGFQSLSNDLEKFIIKMSVLIQSSWVLETSSINFISWISHDL